MTNCLLSPRCKVFADGKCDPLKCFPHRKLCALQAESGMPEAYRAVSLYNPEFLRDNPRASAFMADFIRRLPGNVDRGDGLFIYSKGSRENPRGTGTGKTTAVCCVLNHFLAGKVIEQSRTGIPCGDMPGMFINASVFQNIYNEQFRGEDEAQAIASARYYSIKRDMDNARLLVLDDLGLRGATEAFRSELYEIIDTRATWHLSTLITSNMGLDGISTVLDERISSRISAMGTAVQFTGKDHRMGTKGGVVVC